MPSDRDGLAARATSPNRLWSVDEANAKLSELSELLPRLRASVVRVRKVHDELHRLAEFWGKELRASDHPDQPLRDRLTAEWADLTRSVESEVRRLKDEGIELKDLESGLVDFYALNGEDLILLCWRRGEGAVEFFHTLEGGFRNRRPISELTGAPTRPTAGHG